MSDESPRVSLGLDDAAEGDLRGVLKFVKFVTSELSGLGHVEFHPDVAARLASLRSETRDLAQFLDGYLSGRGGK